MCSHVITSGDHSPHSPLCACRVLSAAPCASHSGGCSRGLQVSPAVLYEPHQRLKVSRESSQTQVAAAGRMRETLTRETATNARLHDEVRAYEARRTHLERVKVLGMKRTWMVRHVRRGAHATRQGGNNQIKLNL